jgi:FKBP-type peptidyl-prolyl cis-trans isomerase
MRTLRACLWLLLPALAAAGDAPRPPPVTPAAAPLASGIPTFPGTATPVPPARAPVPPARASVLIASVPAPPDVAAPPADATVTASGLAFKAIRVAAPSTAPDHANADSGVTVHYSAWTTDGALFDSSVARGLPETFSLRAVIPGWTEGLQRMEVGDLYRFWIPPALGYASRVGERDGTVVFDVELLAIHRPPPAPPDLAGPPAHATRTASGLGFQVLSPGSGGPHPTPASRITAHFSLWTADGALYDSTLTRDRPFTARLDATIAGFSEGLQRMTVGERARLWVPESLAYQGQPGRLAGMLVFDVELLSFAEPPPAPPDVAGPPPDALRTPSGLALKVLQPGRGGAHPSPAASVTAHYTGWTTDGVRFDSSRVRERPFVAPLSALIAGFSEGVQRMTIGEQARVWIPEALAYKGHPGKPAGMLVFDIELLSFVEPSASPPPAPPTPAERLGPPPEATRTASGLAFIVLKPGTGTTHPSERSRFTGHLTGWTAEGTVFDTTTSRSRPYAGVVQTTLRGVREALLEMTAGEQRRLWVPEALTYGGQAGAPAGTLVIDLELLGFDEPPRP